jgi:hypothetical protein
MGIKSKIKQVASKVGPAAKQAVVGIGVGVVYFTTVYIIAGVSAVIANAVLTKMFPNVVETSDQPVASASAEVTE